MSRLLVNCVLFFMGLALAAGFVRYTRDVRSARLPTSVSLKNVSIPSTRVNSLAPGSRRHLLSFDQENSKRQMRMLEQALRSDSLAELSLLQSEEIRSLPRYRTQVLARLKLITLEVLLERFSEADWRTWPLGALDFNRKPTKARQYVDALWQVNSDLARFAETAAYLLHGMFASISSGRPYPIRQDLQFLMMNAKEVLSARRSAADDSASAFSADILQDAGIYLSFERVRAELTRTFNREHPFQREAQFVLLLDLDPRVFDAGLLKSLKESLQNLSLNASGEYRAEILPAVVDSRLLSLLASEHSSIARALAQLYLVGSVDAVEAGREELAQRLLLRSESTYGGLDAQKVMGSFIKSQMEAKRSAEAQPQPTEEVRTSIQDRRVVPASKSGGGIGWATIFLLIALAAGALYGLRVMLERRSSKQVSGVIKQSKASAAASKPQKTISHPSELDFDSDPFEADIDFDLEAANR